MQDTELTLASVAQAFDDWRASRKSARAQTPKDLRQQAIALLESHRISHVIDALRLNSATLKSWKLKLEGSPDSPLFVALPSTVKKEPKVSQPLQITLRTSLGAEIIVSGELSPAQLTALVQGLQSAQGATA